MKLIFSIRILLTDCSVHNWGSFGTPKCDEGWGICVQNDGKTVDKGWYSKGKEIPMNEQEWEKSDIKKWKNNDILHLRLNFENGEVQMKKNEGRFWNLPQLKFQKGKEYSLALHVKCEGMKMKLIECKEIFL